jgi:hypothetical protein
MQTRAIFEGALMMAKETGQAQVPDIMNRHVGWNKVQANNRAALESAFDRGLVVVGYERDAEGNGSFLLGPWNDAQQGAWSTGKTK